MSELLPDVERAYQAVGPGLARMAMLERKLIEQEAKPGHVVLSVDNARGYYVGQELVSLDRELRRTAAAVKRQDLDLRHAVAESVAGARREFGVRDWETLATLEFADPRDRPKAYKRSRHGVRPDMPGASSLKLVTAEEGSSHLLLEPLGFIVSLFTSQPLTALLNAAAWSGYVRRVRVWIGKPSDPLKAVNGRQVITVLQAFGGEVDRLLGEPDGEARFDGPELHLPDGSVARGRRRIRYIQHRADGSTDWLEIE